jgi:hypothetical protein
MTCPCDFEVCSSGPAKADVRPEIAGVDHQLASLFSFWDIAFVPLACMLILYAIYLCDVRRLLSS